MGSIEIGCLAFACVFGSALLGLWLHSRLPSHHVKDDSKDMIKLGTGLIGTMVALILGLLVASAKSNFDSATAAVTQGAAKVIVFDRVLLHYGPQASPIRQQLRQAVVDGIAMVWPRHATAASGLSAFERAVAMETMQDELRALQPANPVQAALQAQAVSLAGEMVASRWGLIVQEQNTLPPTLLAMLLAWMSVLYLGFGLLAPAHRTVVIVLLLCSLSMAAAVFAINEMNRPFEGVIKVSSAPMLKALDHLGK